MWSSNSAGHAIAGFSTLMRSRCLMSRSNFRQTLSRCRCALPLFPSWEFTGGSGVGEESIF